jgi:hypothetical protein
MGTIRCDPDHDSTVRNNAIAAGIIKGTLSDSQLRHVTDICLAAEIWDKQDDTPTP